MTCKTVAETSSTKIAGKAYRSGAGVRQNKAGDGSWVRSGYSESELSVGGAVGLVPGGPPTAHTALGGAGKAALATAPQALRSAGFHEK